VSAFKTVVLSAAVGAAVGFLCCLAMMVWLGSVA